MPQRTRRRGGAKATTAETNTTGLADCSKGLQCSAKQAVPTVAAESTFTPSPVEKFNAPTPAQRAVAGFTAQNAVNNPNVLQSGGAAVLKLAGVAVPNPVASPDTVVVPSFPASPNSPVDATSNAKNVWQKRWDLQVQASTDKGVTTAKPIGNETVSGKTKSGGGRGRGRTHRHVSRKPRSTRRGRSRKRASSRR